MTGLTLGTTRSRLIDTLIADIEYYAQEAFTLLYDAEQLIEDYPASIAARLASEKPDPHSATQGSVTQIPEEESACLTNRKLKAETAIKKLINTQSVPTVGFCGSGGGIRAMYETLGWLSGAEQIGLLNTVQYVCGLSGSTWALNPWILSELSISDYKKEVVPQLTKPFTTLVKDMTTKDTYELLTALARAYYSRGRISLIDLYGGLLSHIFLKGLKNVKQPYMATLSSLRPQIESGAYPYVISTTVVESGSAFFSHKPSFEFSPLYAGSYELDTFTPIWALGRPFKNGTSQVVEPSSLFPEVTFLEHTLEYIAPSYTSLVEGFIKLSSFINKHDYYGHEVPLGYLMATCGSAFAVDTYEILVDLYQLLSSNPSDEKEEPHIKALLKVLQSALDIELSKLAHALSHDRLSEEDIKAYIEEHGLAAATYPNPNYKMSSSPLSSLSEITLVDGGLDLFELDRLNIGIMPLLHRKVDLIFILDSSEDIENSPSLHAAEKCAQQLNLPFPKINYDGISTRHATLIIDHENKEAPVIVYMPVLLNNNFNTHKGRQIDPQSDLFY